MHVLPNIFQSKDNKAIKFGYLIECKNRNVFLQKSCQKWGRQTSSTPFFDLLKNDYWSRDILDFKFLEKGPGIGFSPYFVSNFLRNMFRMLYSINWPNLIVLLPLNSWDTWQYVYCNCLFPRLQRHRLWK